MATVIWDGITYTRAHASGLTGGGAVSIATKRSTTPTEIYFKRTGDLSDWSMAPVLVGTYSGTQKQFQVRQLIEAGRADLIVTNGIDMTWKSIDGGVTWAEL